MSFLKIFVAGHNGLVGSAIMQKLTLSGKYQPYGYSRQQLDLLDRKHVIDTVKKDKPDVIIVAAAKVGGIKANFDLPVEFLSENIRIQDNLMKAAHESDIAKLIFLGSSCIYPKFADQPIAESSLLTGVLEPTNEPYALAKIVGLKLVTAYRREYNHNWISAMPTNIYGPRDNFDPNSSHVLPALIRKFHDAKTNGNESVTLWGTGAPLREFLHADDLAAAVIFLMENYSDEVPLNIGSGFEISIKDLARIIARVVGFEGAIHWDSKMPDGTPRKLLDSSKIQHLGWKPTITLEEGITSTYKWFLENTN